ncbi:MAG: hypothetical protein ACXVA7_22515 [Isosphaeraceae bacterium]
MRLLSQSPYDEVEFLVQLVQVSAHQVPHLDVFEVVPAALVPRGNPVSVHHSCPKR